MVVSNIALLEDIKHELWLIDIPSPTVPEYIEHHEQVQSVMKKIDKKIEEIKNSNAYWEERYVEDENPWMRRRFYCSNCGEWNTYGKPKYCPDCGARMES